MASSNICAVFSELAIKASQHGRNNTKYDALKAWFHSEFGVRANAAQTTGQINRNLKRAAGQALIDAPEVIVLLASESFRGVMSRTQITYADKLVDDLNSRDVALAILCQVDKNHCNVEFILAKSQENSLVQRFRNAFPQAEIRSI